MIQTDIDIIIQTLVSEAERLEGRVIQLECDNTHLKDALIQSNKVWDERCWNLTQEIELLRQKYEPEIVETAQEVPEPTVKKSRTRKPKGEQIA